MFVNKILVAYDGSSHSQKALEWAVNLCKQTGAQLYLVTVLAPVATAFLVDPEGITNYAYDMQAAIAGGLRKVVQRAEQYCKDSGVTVSANLLHGNPIDEITSFAEEIEANMIICGSRGLGGFEGLLLGSITHRLVTYAKIPVMVIK